MKKELSVRSQNKPGLSSIDGASELASYWPRALAHLGDPYDNGGSPWVVIGEYSTLPCRESKGARVVSVALVPEARAVELVQGTAATGWKVDSHGPRPIVDPGRFTTLVSGLKGRAGTKGSSHWLMPGPRTTGR